MFWKNWLTGSTWTSQGVAAPTLLARSPEARSSMTIWQSQSCPNFYICKIQTHTAVASSERTCALLQLRASLETSLALRQSNYSFSGSPASTFWRQDDLSHAQHISTILHWQLLLSSFVRSLQDSNQHLYSLISVLYWIYLNILISSLWVSSKEYFACDALMTSKNSCQRSKSAKRSLKDT